MKRKKESLLSKTGTFLFFAGPACVLFIAVLVVPLIYGFYLTATDWNGISSVKNFVGLQNYYTAFKETKFWHSILLTCIYTAASTIITNVLAFVLARLVTGNVRGSNFFRAGFFTPNLIGGIILGYIWQFVFTRALVFIGKNWKIPLLSASWLSDPTMAMIALIIVTVWQYSGYMMIIYIAGLLSVPQELTEAAMLDGCTKKQALRYVTIPMMTSSFVVCLFLSITKCFMSYDLNIALTEGGPFGATIMASMYVYQKAFSSKEYGLGQTEAVILFAVCAVIAVLQVYFTKRKEIDA